MSEKERKIKYLSILQRNIESENIIFSDAYRDKININNEYDQETLLMILNDYEKNKRAYNADNRLFLIYQPNGYGVQLAKKRTGLITGMGEELDKFYHMIHIESSSYKQADDVVLFNEERDYGNPWEFSGVDNIDGVFVKFMRMQ